MSKRQASPEEAARPKLRRTVDAKKTTSERSKDQAKEFEYHHLTFYVYFYSCDPSLLNTVVFLKYVYLPILRDPDRLGLRVVAFYTSELQILRYFLR
jgi:hypothetical protein